MPRTFLMAAIALLVAGLPPADAATCLYYADSPRQIGMVDTPGTANEVATLGTHAYVANNTDLLQVVDIADPSAPAIVATVPLGGAALRVTVEGAFAYVATTNGLQVVDLANPAAPVARGIVATTATAKDVAAAGTTVYVGLGTSGLDVIDCSVPATPVLVTTLPDRTEQLTVEGTRLATTSGSGYSVRLYDIAAPLAPSLLGTAQGWDNPDDLVTNTLLSPMIAGDFVVTVFVEETEDWSIFDYYYYSWLTVFDFSNPSVPVWTWPGLLSLNEIGIEAVKSGDFVYVVSESDEAGNPAFVPSYELWTVDVTNPQTPVIDHRLRTLSPIYGLATATGPEGAVVLSCASTLGIRTYDVAHPEEPSWAGDPFSSSWAITDVAFPGNWVCAVANGPTGSSMGVHDRTDPDNLVLMGSLNTVGYWYRVVATGDKIFMPEYTGTLYRSAADPVTGVPSPAVAVTSVTGIDDLAAAASPYLLAAKGSAGVTVLDASPAGDPAVVLDLPAYPASLVAVDGATGVTLDANTLRTLDLTIPSSAAYAGSATSIVTSWITAGDGLAVVGGGSTIEIFDISDVSNPVSVSSLTFLDGVAAGAIDGNVNLLYLALANTGVAAVDVHDPPAAQLIGVIPTDAAFGVAFRDGKVWACEGARVTALPPSCGTVVDVPNIGTPAGTRLVVAPNPFREVTSIRYAASRSGPVSADLFDVRGRLVRRLSADAEDGVLTWDGRSGTGAQVAPGIYFVRLQSPKGAETAKVVRLR